MGRRDMNKDPRSVPSLGLVNASGYLIENKTIDLLFLPTHKTFIFSHIIFFDPSQTPGQILRIHRSKFSSPKITFPVSTPLQISTSTKVSSRQRIPSIWSSLQDRGTPISSMN